MGIHRGICFSNDATVLPLSDANPGDQEYLYQCYIVFNADNFGCCQRWLVNEVCQIAIRIDSKCCGSFWRFERFGSCYVFDECIGCENCQKTSLKTQNFAFLNSHVKAKKNSL